MAPNGEQENPQPDSVGTESAPSVPASPAAGPATAVMTPAPAGAALPPPPPWGAVGTATPTAAPPATPPGAVAVADVPLATGVAGAADVTLIGTPPVATGGGSGGDVAAVPVAKPGRGRFWAKFLGIVAAIVVALIAIALAAVYLYDGSQKNVVLPGVRVDGTDVGGKNIAAVKQMLAADLAERQAKEITFTAGPQKFPRTLGSLGLTANTDEVAAAALNGSKATTANSGDAFGNLAGMFTRTYHRLTNSPLNVDVTTTYSFANPKEMQDFAAGVAAAVNTDPKDASLTADDNGVTITKSVPGRAADVPKIVGAFDGKAPVWAASTTPLAVDLAVNPVAPKVTEASLGKTIYVSKAKRQLTLYDGSNVVKQYTVAIGSPAHPTPSGTFEIEEKRKNPVWINPAKSTWGASMPASIPPGPGNPLGTRAMNLNAPGIRIHGTNNVGSLGDAASHGCIRMAIPQVEELFDLVDVGTRVIIK